MKKAFIFCAFFVAAAACVEESDLTKQTGNQSPSIPPAVNLEDSISVKVFDYLNLDYPGLEAVKEHWTKATEGEEMNESELYLAAYELREYYRQRSFTMPDYSFVNPNVSTNDYNKADQACGYRFYVKNFTDGTTADGQEQYYQFPTSTDKNGNTVIDWTYIPKDLSFSESEWKSQRFRHQWMLPQAMAYAATHDDKYIKNWITVYGDFMRQYPCPEGEIGGKSDENINATIWKDLQISARTSEQPAIIKYYINSELFTPGWLTQVLATYAEGVESIIVNPYYAPENNIYFSQIAAISVACITFPEFKNADAWSQYATAQIKDQLDLQFREDGVHNDLDPSYHFGTVSNFYSTYRLAQANGRTDIFPENQLKKLKNACRFFVDIAYPDYSLEYFNDTRSHGKSVLIKNYKWYSEMFPDDEEILWVAYEGRKGTEPDDKLITYPKGGYYMMRNGWKKDATMLILKNNDNYDQRWHCQPDNNTISLYRNGRHFLPDAGAFSYGGSEEDNSNRATYAATVMHNTLTSNGATIAKDRMRGRMLKAETKGNNSLLVTENDSYDGMSHRRAVFFVDDFFVIVDEGYGDKQHTATLSFRLCETKNDVVEDAYADEANAYGVHTIFGDKNNMVFKTFAETTEGWSTKCTTSYYSPEIGQKIQRKFYQVNISKPADKAARFITVIYPFGSPEQFDALGISARFTDNEAGSEGTFHASGVSVEVKIGDKTYPLTYTLD